MKELTTSNRGAAQENQHSKAAEPLKRTIAFPWRLENRIALRDIERKSGRYLLVAQRNIGVPLAA